MKQSTNILVIQADQLAAGFLGAYGNTTASTPFIDSLAEQETVFESAYTNFPLCAPSRFLMMSGQLASTIGAFDNGAEFPSSIPTFAHYLRALNYHTCLVGKMHFVGADQLHGFEQRLTTDIYRADFGWTGDWTEVKPEHSNDKITFTQAGVCVRNTQMEYDEEVSHRAVRKIYDLARDGDERPFLLFTSFTHPHDPYQCTQEYWDRYRHEDIDMPHVAPISDAENDPYSLRLRVQYGMSDFEPTEQQVRIARHAYYGSVSYFDDTVGKLLQALQTTGLDENTVIIVTTDHGDMMGERGLWYKKSFFEASCRVPLIIAGKNLPARRSNVNVSLVDLLPTLLDIAGDSECDSLVEPVAGKTLWGIAQGTESIAGDIVYSENLAEGATAPIVMVKKGPLKYIYSGVDPDQLFDLSKDPYEVNNVIDDPLYREAKAELAELVLKQWDIAHLNESILQSQKRRLFLRKVLQVGKVSSWDFKAPDQAEWQCLRADDVYNRWAYGGTLK